MLSAQALSDLVKRGESERVEFKESAQGNKVIRRAICAFANDLSDSGQPGVIVLGLRDDCSCADLTIDDKLLSLLGGFRSDGKIMPFPIMSVERRKIGECDVAVIEVEPSINTPHRVDGRCWVRVGASLAQATREEERRLAEKRISLDLPFDSRELQGSTIADLDSWYFERFYLPSAVSQEVLEENDRSPLEQLQALRFLGRSGSPNPAALLTLAHEPRDFFPFFHIQFLRFEGEEMTDPIRSQYEVSGRLIEQLEEITRLLKANVESPMLIEAGAKHQVRYDFPPLALTQVVYNAVMHRTYEANSPIRVYWYRDRVEVSSPGGLHGGVTEHNLGKPGATSYRNPLVAEVMKNAGFAERFGVGLQMAQSALRRNGSPPLKFDIDANFVSATIRIRA